MFFSNEILRVKSAVIDLKPHAGTRIQKPSLFVFKALGFSQYIMILFCLLQTNATGITKLLYHIWLPGLAEFHILHEQRYNSNKERMLFNTGTHNIKINMVTVLFSMFFLIISIKLTIDSIKFIFRFLDSTSYTPSVFL